MKKTKTALYRHFNKAGELLYVGISLSAVYRLSRHSAAPWNDEIARVDIQYIESRKAALEAERTAIKTERPLFNKHHTPTNKPASPMETIMSNMYRTITAPLPDFQPGEKIIARLIRFETPEAMFSFLREFRKYARRMERRAGADSIPPKEE